MSATLGFLHDSHRCSHLMEPLDGCNAVFSTGFAMLQPSNVLLDGWNSVAGFAMLQASNGPLDGCSAVAARFATPQASNGTIMDGCNPWFSTALQASNVPLDGCNGGASVRFATLQPSDGQFIRWLQHCFWKIHTVAGISWSHWMVATLGLHKA